VIALIMSAAPAQAEPPPAALQPPRPPPPAPSPAAPRLPPFPTRTAPPTRPAPDAAAPDRAAGLITPIWREPAEPLDLPWHILALPEYVVELVFSPLGFVVGVVERHRIDRRIIDFLRNDAGTIKVVPAFKFSGGDGFGIGASLDLDNLFGHEEELAIGGLIQLNRDYKLETGYEQAIASIDGRTLEASIEYELNSDLDYYGLGNLTRPRDQRVVERRGVDALASLEVFPRGSHDSYGLVEVGYRRTALGPGNEAGTPSAGEPDDTVIPTPDFGRTINYALVGMILRHDSRDTLARTQRGILAEIHGRFTSGLGQGSDVSALSMRGEITGFLPVLPLYRVLVARLGLQGVLGPNSDGNIPLEDYVMLGRQNGLRGFANYRFRDQLGWWATLEYRYPIYRYEDSPFMMSPSVFADVGRVGDTVSDLWHKTLHWSVGFGIAGEVETTLIVRFEVGYSREGIQTGFTLGKEL
jgi:Omp85 superfamily domain